MCFKKPRPPKVRPDPALQAQIALSKDEERERRRLAKANRLEDTLATLGGMGRRSLLTGGRGGMGFALPSGRSLLA